MGPDIKQQLKRMSGRRKINMNCSLTLSAVLLAFNAHATTNEHITFLQDLPDSIRVFSKQELRRWKMPNESDAIPESADFSKLDHVRLFLAANPERYEPYVQYGGFFFKIQKFDVAALAYEKATEIINRDGIKHPAEYWKFYIGSLVMLYLAERETDKAQALKTFQKIVDLDFDFFDRESKLAEIPLLAALDYENVGDWKSAKRLIVRARQLKTLSNDVRNKMELIYRKMDTTEPPAGSDSTNLIDSVRVTTQQ